MSQAEVATQESGTLEAFRAFYDPDLDFRRLASQLTGVARGFRLVEKDDLIAIPHIVISVTWREGFLRGEGGNEIQGDYVSVEAVVADDELLKSPQVRALRKQAKVDDREIAVFPNEAVIYNDGGTGIRRKLTSMFNDVGMIDVGGKGDDDGRYDRPYSLWAAGADLATAGIRTTRNGAPLAWGVPRGLRKSVYPNPAAPKEDAETFYFA